jgi:hypothetical protein
VEQSYAYAAWFFIRALCLIYIVAFVSLAVQGRGLWGSQGLLPIATHMQEAEKVLGSDRIWQMPSVFWLSSSDDFIFGAAVTGAACAGLALVGFAQGWCLLACFVLYLGFCQSGQAFMQFQWDSLLLELGFLALFAVPWNLDFSLHVAKEPHAFVRGLFYIVLFKLMFLSGVVKLLSGDEAWRDLTALKYHYWTQPLPNPVSAFMNALPRELQQVSTGFAFIVELLLPFFIFWRVTRIWAAAGFISLTLLILVSGNFAFFNWLTLALCFWLIPDRVWEYVVDLLPFKLQHVSAQMFPHPIVSVVMGMMAVLSLLWCMRPFLIDEALDFIAPILNVAQNYRVSNSYGLFAVMTKSRPEIVIEGSADGQSWKEYVFKYKPGPLDRSPPMVAPYQPRLDWQLWFAAMGSVRSNPWVETLMQRLFEGSAPVLQFFSENPFPDHPPKFLRAKVYNYEFVSVDEILNNDLWWTRKFDHDYTPTYQR